MDYKLLIIRGISYSQTQSEAYALLLEHEETHIKLPIVIGSSEAQSISLGLEKDLQSPRPLTHDIFTTFMMNTGFEVISVLIYQIIDGVFFSNINLRNSLSGNEMVLDARTSDAVAMAVRFDAPIFTTQQVLDDAGILLDLEDNSIGNTVENTADYLLSNKSTNKLESISTNDLQLMLEDAVEKEDFNLAMEIQNELNKRNKKID